MNRVQVLQMLLQMLQLMVTMMVLSIELRRLFGPRESVPAGTQPRHEPPRRPWRLHRHAGRRLTW